MAEMLRGAAEGLSENMEHKPIKRERPWSIQLTRQLGSHSALTRVLVKNPYKDGGTADNQLNLIHKPCCNCLPGIIHLLQREMSSL